jgi:hypothetical protein
MLVSQSQQRMLSNATQVRVWANQHKDALKFFQSEHFKTSLILLDPTYGLTAFMTLNDRASH